MLEQETPTQGLSQQDIDKRVFALYDEYCHGYIDRREFMRRAGSISVAGVSALAMAQAVMPQYARAQTISFTDKRIKATYVEYPSPGGTSGKMRGYLVQPTTPGPYPAVVVIHENRGLNPYIEDVVRRFAAADFLAFGPDALTPLGGYPGNDDAGREMQARLDRDAIIEDFVAAAEWLMVHPQSTGRVGAVGFCFGGGVVNTLAVRLPNLGAGVPFYGGQPPAEDVPRIQAPLMIQYAEIDERVNAGWPAYERALRANGKHYVMHMYAGTNHGFHNDTTPRYDERAAKLAQERTIAFFNQHLR